MKSKKAVTRFTTAVELIGFLWERKLWWMIPMVLILVLFGGLMIFAQTSPLAPLLYPLF
jgi:hypothetical protein